MGKSIGGTSHGWSRLEEISCPRSYYYKYVLQLRQPADINLEIGTSFHAALAYRFGALRDEKEPSLAACLQAAEEVVTPDIYRSHVRRLVETYWEEWPLPEPFSVVCVEHEHEMMIEDAPFTGRLDTVVQQPDGRLFVLEHKTSGINPAYAHNFDLYLVDHQITGYAVLAEALLGRQISGVIVDLMYKGSKKKGKPDEYSGQPVAYRETFLRSDDQKADFRRQVVWMNRAIRHASTTGEWWCQPKSCHKYRPCPYAMLCQEPRRDPAELWLELGGKIVEEGGEEE